MDLRLPFRGRWQRQQLTPEQAQQQRIDQRLRAIERQGSGSSRFAHWLAYLLVVAFSAGALVALAGDAVRTFLTQAHAGVVDIPSLISFVVSFVLVFAMDTSMVIAATTVRMLDQRHQSGAWRHLLMIAGVCLIESATYLYMSYVYDHPNSGVAWAILAARAVAAPIMAVYLSLARTLPISARDINTQVEVVTGRGVLVEMTRIADDPDATTERKVALYQASAIMDAIDQQRLARIIAAERATRGDLSAPAPTPAPVPLPAPQTPPPAASARLSNHDLRRLRLQRDMQRDLATEDTDDDDWGAYSGADDLGAYDDDLPGLRVGGHPTSPRPRASFSNHTGRRNGSSPARMAQRERTLVLDDDLDDDEDATASPVTRTPIFEDDTREGRRIIRWLDRHPGANAKAVQMALKVQKATAGKWLGRWSDRQPARGMVAPSMTVEMPAVLPEKPHATEDADAESMRA